MKRHLSLSVLVVLILAGATGFSQERPLQKVVLAVTTKDISVGHAAHSSLPLSLGYWKSEGLDVSVVGVEGSTLGIQQVVTGNINVLSTPPESILLSREKGVKIRAFYVQARDSIMRLVVTADSPIQTVTGLKGKTVGVPSLADAGLLQYTRTLAASVGLEATDFKFLGVGVGSPGALALQQKRIDALALWDTLQASLENQGMSFRRLETPVVHELFGQSLAARDDYIEQHADILIGLARGIAKATVFGLANPEASVRIHWKMYPQTRPQSGDDATLLKSAINVFNSRFASQRVDHRDDKRFGAATIAQWRALEALQRKYGVITGPVRPEDLYTDRLIEAINAFDQQAIVREARAYKAAN